MVGKAFKVWLGKPYPLGAAWDGAGVNFALFSEHAERDNAVLMLKSKVVDTRFDWGDDKPPAVAWSDSIII